MIAFGSSISGAEAFRRYGEPGIRRIAEPSSELLFFASVESVSRTYNLILDAAAGLDDLEALVLVHPHTEIVDPDFCAKVRAALSDPSVGAVGCSGATRVTGIAWWEGCVVSAPVTHRYEEHGGGELPSYSWTERHAPPADVEALDGQLLVLSPWAVRELRFNEELLFGHGSDVDFSLRVRTAGRRLTVVDLRVVHHRSLELVADIDVWVQAHAQVARTWRGTLDEELSNEEDWKRRTRRAEAEREAARTIAFSEALALDARVLELERALAEKTESVSWRLTAPLRAVNRLRRATSESRKVSR